MGVTDIAYSEGAAPVSGSVGSSPSQYRITGLVPDMGYAVNFSNVSGDIDPNFYTASNFTGSRNCGDFLTGSSGACIVQANADGQLFV